MGESSDGTVKTRFKICLRELLEPETFGYWGCIQTQKLFALYQWMAETAQTYYRYGTSGAFDLLNGQPTVKGTGELRSFGQGWEADLQRRFQYILMSRHAGPLAQQWRDDHQITLDSVRWVQQPWTESGWAFGDAGQKREFDAYFAHTEAALGPQTLQAELNSCHKERSRTIQRVTLSLSAYGMERKYGEPKPARWLAVLHYGYPQDGSSWQHRLATQEKGEPLLFMVRRALAELKRLQGPALAAEVAR